jgi:hypothetical protein
MGARQRARLSLPKNIEEGGRRFPAFAFGVSVSFFFKEAFR